MDRRAILALRSFLFFFHSTATIVISFLPLYFQHQGLTGEQIGWLLAVGPFAALVAQPFWGYFSDRYRTVKRMVNVTLGGFLLTSIILFQMETFASLMAVSALFFLFMSPTGALGDSLAQKSADAAGISFGSIRTWGSIGFATTSLVVGQVLSAIGVQNILFPFLLYGVAAFSLSFLITDMRVEPQPLSAGDALRLMRRRELSVFLLLIPLITVTHRANDSFIGIYMTALGAEESLVGWAWFIGVISEALVFATARFWFRRFRPLTFIIVAGFLYSVRWLLFSVAESPAQILMLQVFHGVTFGLFYLTAFQYMTNVVPKKLQATGHLLFIAVFFGFSGIVGSLFGGIFLESFGGRTLYFVMAVLAFFGTLALIAFRFLTGSVTKERAVRAG